MGVLYVVATPIGNLEDITLRALRILRQVRLIAAEDTRTTAKLLARYEIHTPMISFFEHNELVKQEQIIQTLAVDGQDVTLVSEAGMPAISDPGYRLVQAAIAADLCVEVVPGPSAVLAALAISGLPTDSFVFLGFLPRRQAARRRLLASLQHEPRTIVCFEAPHRLSGALQDMYDALGDRQLVAACELTKLYEEVWRGPVSDGIRYLQEKPARGEYTLVLAGAPEHGEVVWEEERVRSALASRLAQGMSSRDAVAAVAKEAHWHKRDAYRLVIRGTNEDDPDGGTHAGPGRP